jgi:hypothetical protein
MRYKLERSLTMKSVKTSNIKCRQFVQSRQPFTANNLFAVHLPAQPDLNLTERYVVYSYGTHFPLFVWQACDQGSQLGMWFENQDRYSVTTSKHRSQSHPHYPTQPMTTGAMRRIVEDGIAGLAVLGEAKH